MSHFHYSGLSDAQVASSRAEHGSNELSPPEVEGFIEKLLENFKDPLIKILMVALGITTGLAALGYAEWIEGIGIATAVFIATVVATYSEYKNESSFRALQYEASQVQNKVFRNGAIHSVLVDELVKGDLVLLEPGDLVPADGNIVEGELFALQSNFTGEPEPVRKVVPPADYAFPRWKNEGSEIVFDEPYACWRGSMIDDGTAVLRVENVGVNTYYGTFLETLNASSESESPLQEKLTALADGVSTLGYMGAIFIACSFLFKQFVMDNQYDWARIVAYASNWQLALKDGVTSVILGIIVIVVAVPEGLPMMIAIVLSINMRKLLRENVLVRKLLGIESAGSLNVLFVDKTGTLTKGVFATHSFIAGSGDSFAKYDTIPPALRGIAGFSLKESVSSVLSEGVIVGGNASDRALLSYLERGLLASASDAEVVRQILFNSARKFSAVTLRPGKESSRLLPEQFFARRNNGTVTVVKGAPEIILDHCATFYDNNGAVVQTKDDFRQLRHKITNLSRQGIRVIALGCTLEALAEEVHPDIPRELTLVGIVGVVDEIRPETTDALNLCRQAGVQVVMITGDKVETAIAVAAQIGLLNREQVEASAGLSASSGREMPPAGSPVLESRDLRLLSDVELGDRLAELRVVARALPTDKSRLVTIAQSRGLVAGMTGDGANDTAALKMADVGFAMGSGSEVAKEAGDIVILDDNFLSITKSILFGRTIFRSIRKFVVFQSTVNFASFIPVFLGPFLGFDFPLTLIQLLWVNLVMDTLAALAFGGEAPLSSYMQEAPIPRKSSIIDPLMWSSIVCNGFFVGLSSIVFLTWDPVLELFTRNGEPDTAVFLTAFFSFFIFSTTFNAFNVRTNSVNLLDHIMRNKGFVFVVALIFVVQVSFTYVGGDLLRCVWLLPHEWTNVILLSALIIPFDIIRKLIFTPLLAKKRAAPAAALRGKKEQ
jgi:Ca2+-transporting ATPase